MFNNVFKQIENDYTSSIFNMNSFFNVMKNRKIGYEDKYIVQMYLEFITKKPVFFDGGDLVDSITQQTIRSGSAYNQFDKDELVVIINDWYEQKLRHSQEILKFFKNITIEEN